MPDSFQDRVEKRAAQYAASVGAIPFDPDGEFYDEKRGEEIANSEKYRLTIPKPERPENPFEENVVEEEGKFEAWVWHPEEQDWVKHKGSIDPETGMLLKGMKHETAYKAVDYEASQGREFVKKSDGRYYLQDKKK